MITDISTVSTETLYGFLNNVSKGSVIVTVDPVAETFAVEQDEYKPTYEIINGDPVVTIGEPTRVMLAFVTKQNLLDNIAACELRIQLLQQYLAAHST